MMSWINRSIVTLCALPYFSCVASHSLGHGMSFCSVGEFVINRILQGVNNINLELFY